MNFRNTTLTLFLTVICLYAGYGQGLVVEQGSYHSTVLTTGYGRIGIPTDYHLSLDPRGLQARDGFGNTLINTTMFLNRHGGNMDLLGSSNSTGDLIVDGTGLFYHNSTNRTGLGTTVPEARLHIFNGNGPSTATSPTYDLYIEDDASAYIALNGSNSGLVFNDDNSAFRAGLYYINSSNRMDLRTNGSNRMSINADGDVGIGTTAPSAKMDINHNSTLNDPHIELNSNGGDNFARLKFRSNTAAYWNIAATTNGNSRMVWDYFSGSGAVLNPFELNLSTSNASFDMDIIQPGSSFDVGNSATEHWDQMWANSFNVASDQRLKNNILDLPDNTLDRVKQLRAVSYHYNDDISVNGRKRLGFIAQEVQPLFPEAVITEDVDVDPQTGEKIVTKHEYLGMNYTELVPVLVKAIQEQQEIIDQLEARLKVVESNK